VARTLAWVFVAAVAGQLPLSTVPRGALNARPATELLDAWAHRSLWVKDLAGVTAPECFDFNRFDDCVIWSADDRGRLSRKGGRFCEVQEFIVGAEPGHVPGNYGLIIGGAGSSYTVSFAQRVTRDVRTFRQADRPAGWSFEVFDGPCATRARH
jgi:hypothetical protein